MDLPDKIKAVSEEIFKKYGTDSYLIRCRLYDIRKESEAISALIDWAYANCNPSNSDELYEIIDKL